ncbi:MAG: mechanosensitive ion channel family protein [Candidatus Gastranaerophilales bacterium]|nr:mechanosensitive ion channel family protein [Candidatus Gastranaerophilales bacterium]
MQNFNFINYLTSFDYKAVIFSPPSIIIIRVIIFLAILKLIHIIVDKFTNKLLSKTQDIEHIKQIHTVMTIIKSILDVFLFIMFFMALLTRLGVDIRPFLTAAGILGIAVGFGAKRFIEDIISGMIILFEGQIRVGDVIEITDKIGVVEKMNLKMVVLRDLEGKVHFVRNGMIDIVTNLTRDYSYSIGVIGVAYKEKVDFVIETLQKTFEENLMTEPDIADKILEPIQIFGIESFGDNAINIKYRIKTKPMFQWLVGYEFKRLIKNKFDEIGIEIPFPQRNLTISSVDMSKLNKNS